MFRMRWVTPCALTTLFACSTDPIELFGAIGRAPGQGDAGEGDASVAEAGQKSVDAGFDGDTGEVGAAGSCSTDADCKSSDDPKCETTGRVCVQCLVNADCAGSAKSTCNPVNNRCELPCTADSDCSSDDICDTVHGACVDCLLDSECASSGQPFCVEERCTECIGPQNCPSNQPCLQNSCVACVSNADCVDGGVCSDDHKCN